MDDRLGLNLHRDAWPTAVEPSQRPALSELTATLLRALAASPERAAA